MIELDSSQIKKVCHIFKRAFANTSIVYIKNINKKTLISADNGNIGINCILDADISALSKVIQIELSSLEAIASGGDKIKFTHKDNIVELSCGGTKLKVFLVDEDVLEIADPKESINLDIKGENWSILFSHLSQIVTDASNIILKSVRLFNLDKKLVAISSDSFRIHVVEQDNFDKTVDWLLPAGALNIISKISGNNNIKFKGNDNEIIAEINDKNIDIKIKFSQLDAKYPNLVKLFDTKYEKVIIVNREYMQSVLDRHLGLNKKDKFTAGIFIIDQSQMEVKNVIDISNQEIQSLIDGDNYTIETKDLSKTRLKLRYKYILEAINFVESLTCPDRIRINVASNGFTKISNGSKDGMRAWALIAPIAETDNTGE